MTLPPLNLDRILALADAIGLIGAEVRVRQRQPNDGWTHTYRVEFYAANTPAFTKSANTIEVAANQIEADLEGRARTLLREREASVASLRKAFEIGGSAQGQRT